MLPKSSNTQEIQSRTMELIFQLHHWHSGQCWENSFSVFLTFFQRCLFSLGGEADVLCAWFSVPEPGTGANAQGLPLLRICHGHPHIWREDFKELRVMDVFWKLWRWARVELEWQPRLQHLLISHTEENHKLNGENCLQGFGALKQVETLNLQNLQWSSLKCLWKWMGNTRFSHLLRQSRLLVYPFLQKGVLASNLWFKKCIFRMNFLSQKGKNREALRTLRET